MEHIRGGAESSFPVLPSPMRGAGAMPTVINDDSYMVMHDDEELVMDDDLYGEWDDEFTINWCILCTRVGAIVLLVGVIVCFALGAIKPKLTWLAGIGLAVLAVCLCSSFLECCRKRCSTTYVSRFSFSSPDDPPPSYAGRGGAPVRGLPPTHGANRQAHYSSSPVNV